VRFDESAAAFDGLHRAISRGLVRACHDLSEGGAAVALAEMCFAGGLGADVSLVHAPYEQAADEPGVRDEVLLFSESPGRFLCEVRERDLADFLEVLGSEAKSVPCRPVGRVTADGRLHVRGLRSAGVLDEPIETLREAFTRPLRDGGVR
jgi:phosphoribosylformylglycinamidine (FGAM) synthase-like enzyme